MCRISCWISYLWEVSSLSLGVEVLSVEQVSECGEKVNANKFRCEETALDEMTLGKRIRKTERAAESDEEDAHWIMGLYSHSSFLWPITLSSSEKLCYGQMPFDCKRDFCKILFMMVTILNCDIMPSNFEITRSSLY